MLVEDEPDPTRVVAVWIDEGCSGVKFSSGINILKRFTNDTVKV